MIALVENKTRVHSIDQFGVSSCVSSCAPSCVPLIIMTADDRLLMPGDIVADVQKIAASRKVILGPGLRKHNDTVVACKAGVLNTRAPNIYWIDSYQKRYVPNRGETVIGLVVQKAGDIFRVDIGASEPACLSYLAFEGATKKNRPDVNVGDLVFAKMLIANKDFESELICVNSLGKKDKLGVLAGGFVFNCSINLVRRLLNESGTLCRAIQREIQVPMEMVVGMNGRVWLNGRNVRDVIAVGNAILAAESISDAEVTAMCQRVGSFFTGIKSRG